MIVLTVDQRGSTYAADRVPEVLAELARLTRGREGLVVPFERTVGDEVQGILAAGRRGAELAVDIGLHLLRDQGWSIGIGVGQVEGPLPTVSREARGFAFYRARDAVERAKTRSRGTSVAVEGPPPGAADLRASGDATSGRPASGKQAGDVASGDTASGDKVEPDLAAEVEALLRLLAAVRARRTPQGWEVADTLATLTDKPGRQKIVAQSLNVSEQAVSQRLRAALWQEEEAVRPVVVRLLAELSCSVSSEPDAPSGPSAEAGKGKRKTKRAKS
ncbi:hypothetical protein C8K30_106167 [Promicromonospora sp. AC04]|uniref:hypothetical protein n=1 Tax=Promicromonospora sp. AC04 TaxID=2135723 RepID=UPI000D424617|nr:hypothetical protein [Promicromonospora sp. AC04]PUB26079.1 hypothetical protein C8K30_106167 [Promicromonospora sp. AC04]